MDHAINQLWEYSLYARTEFIREWESGKYVKLSECPSYEEVKAYCKARNVLADYYYQTDYHNHRTPKSVIEGGAYK